MSLHTKNIPAIFLVALSLFGACKSSDAPLSGQVTLKQTQSDRVGNLTIRVDSLSDGRCPSINCIWEGEAYVGATVSNVLEQQRVRLYLNSRSPINRKDSAGVQFSGQTYKVILRNVTPYPDGSNYRNQQAVIQVTKL